MSGKEEKKITKVDISLYKAPIQQMLRVRKYSLKFYDELVDLFTKFLPCSGCNQVLPREKFSKSAQFANRGGHYPKCKDCARADYQAERAMTKGKKRIVVKKRAS